MTPWHDDFSKDLYERLQSTLRAYNAVNFDSLITLTIQLFEEHPRYPCALSGPLPLYHDRRISGHESGANAPGGASRRGHNNLCVVGDDDQSIYGWRGAEIKNILNFKADTAITLEQNYRSTPNILSAANAVIKNNQNRHPKNLWSARPSSEPIEIFNTTTDIEEAQAVVNRIIQFHDGQKSALE